MNTAILSGVISSPQVRYSNDGKPISEFFLSFQNVSNSQSVKQIKCLGFGKLAESIGQMKEGQPVLLVGAINITNKDFNGTKTKITEFKISALESISSPVNINSVNITGRTGQDPEPKYFESGKNKCSASLAVRRTSDQTDWFDLEAWGKTAEVMGNYVRKGGLIGISGQLKFEEWTDKNSGELRSKPIILVGQLELLGGKKEQEEDF
jgi:single-strand DNA-binding protein